jgi:hypothetical protein
VYLLLLFAW